MTDFPHNPELDLVLDRIIDVPVHKVWAAWTQPELMLQWFTPSPWKTVEVDNDLRPGGRANVVMESPEGQRFPNIGSYLEVIPNKRLTFTSVLLENYRPAPKPENGAMDMPFTASIILEDLGGGRTPLRRSLLKKLILAGRPARCDSLDIRITRLSCCAVHGCWPLC